MPSFWLENRSLQPDKHVLSSGQPIHMCFIEGKHSRNCSTCRSRPISANCAREYDFLRRFKIIQKLYTLIDTILKINYFSNYRKNFSEFTIYRKNFFEFTNYRIFGFENKVFYKLPEKLFWIYKLPEKLFENCLYYLLYLYFTGKRIFQNKVFYKLPDIWFWK